MLQALGGGPCPAEGDRGVELDRSNATISSDSRANPPNEVSVRRSNGGWPDHFSPKGGFLLTPIAALSTVPLSRPVGGRYRLYLSLREGSEKTPRSGAD